MTIIPLYSSSLAAILALGTFPQLEWSAILQLVFTVCTGSYVEENFTTNRIQTATRATVYNDRYYITSEKQLFAIK
jgi:hypothetical protein